VILQVTGDMKLGTMEEELHVSKACVTMVERDGGPRTEGGTKGEQPTGLLSLRSSSIWRPESIWCSG
jgi:hypothetical protein